MASTAEQIAQTSTDTHTPAAGTQPAAETHGAATETPAAAPQGADAAHSAEGTHTGTEVPHDGGHGAFPPFDSATFPSQILWLAVAFGLLYLLMSRLALPRVGGILAERSQRIHSDIAEANRLKAESEAASAAYEQALAEARNNAVAIGQKARDAAKADADGKRHSAEAAVSAKIAAAEQSIAASKTKAMKDVGSIAAETAEAIVKALVGDAIGKSEIEKAVKAELAK